MIEAPATTFDFSDLDIASGHQAQDAPGPRPGQPLPPPPASRPRLRSDEMGWGPPLAVAPSEQTELLAGPISVPAPSPLLKMADRGKYYKGSDDPHNPMQVNSVGVLHPRPVSKEQKARSPPQSPGTEARRLPREMAAKVDTRRTSTPPVGPQQEARRAAREHEAVARAEVAAAKSAEARERSKEESKVRYLLMTNYS